MPDLYTITPAGVSPVAEPAPDEVPVQQTMALLADDIDPETGEIASISSAPHAVEAAVREAFRITRESGPAVASVGQSFRAIKKQSASAERELRNEAERIMAPFVTRREAQVLSIDIDPEQAYSQAGVRVRWVNLMTGKQVTT